VRATSQPGVRASLYAAIALTLTAGLAVSGCEPAPSSTLEVETSSGLVLAGQTGPGATAWFAIPYAAPPVGELRWRPPAAPVHASAPIAFHAPGLACAQPGSGEDPVIGAEDCLTLNIYAPTVQADEPRPVMVWIHGGGNYAGAAADYDGSALAARHGLVVVTINYRLGPFGWFHDPAVRTGDDDVPETGEFAVLDMIAALEWIQGNISGFGGDADNVTLFGESAGGQNVYALVLAPSAAGLFHRAISQSGGLGNMALDQALNPVDGNPPGTRASASEILMSLLIDQGEASDRESAASLLETWSPEPLGAWLRSLSTEQVLAAYAGQPDLGYDLPSVVLDDVMHPASGHIEQLRSGNYNQVPLMLGGNRDEQKVWMAFDPAFVDFTETGPVVRDRARYDAVAEHYSDWWNVIAVDEFADHARSPVFTYRFDWDDGPVDPVDFRYLVGAAHGIEIPFVFGDFQSNGYDFMFTAENAAARTALSDAMMSYWAAFAYYGDPGRGMDGDLPLWQAWADGREKLIFPASGLPGMGPAYPSAAELLDALVNDERLELGERCSILRHNTMYPRFDLARLSAAGCPEAE
jgi:para-nitrobenzyl esterase